MSRVAYVNGLYRPHADASVHVEDRGYQFADGVYEVIAVWKGLPVDLDLHLRRLSRGLADLSIVAPMSDAALKTVLRATLRKNRIRNGILYLQVSRGVAPRNHLFPKNVAPSLVVTARPGLGPSAKAIDEGISVIALPDIRWRRRDIKAVALLPNVMAKQKAAEAGAFEAWMTEPDGTVSEAGSSNAWIVDKDGRLVTRPLGTSILAGVTRHVILDLARAAGMEIDERPFSLEEARTAREAFITSTTTFVLPVVEVDGTVIGNGAPGTVARTLRDLYLARLETLTPEAAWA